MCIKLIHEVSFPLFNSSGEQASGWSHWVRGDRFSPYLCLIVLSIKFITASPSQATAPVVRENQAGIFLERLGRFWLICWERKRNYAEVSHQTLTARFKAKRRVEGDVCAFKDTREGNTCNKVLGCLTTFILKTHTVQIASASMHASSCC